MKELSIQQKLISEKRAAAKNAASELLAAKSKQKKAGSNKQQDTKASEAISQKQVNLKEQFDQLGGLISQVYQQKTPQELTEDLSDGNPCLLLPMRIETKFRSIKNKNFLCIRVYPDDIAINTHEELLTEDEYAAGKNYWSSILGVNEETIKQGYWNTIVAMADANRAAWIIKQTKPQNWSLSPSTVNMLNFPVYTSFKSGSWTQAPHSKVMPDKFVFTGYSEGSVAFEASGELIPDDLQMAPDPSATEAQISRDKTTGKISIDKNLSWMFDFETAEKAGMAIRIELTDTQATKGFDRIVVLGLRFSCSATDTVALTEEWINDHHYALSGFSFLKQGTATNNTEDDSSGYESSDFANETSFTIETGNPLFTVTDDPLAKKDAQFFAEALGISTDPLLHISNSNISDINEARFMNKALWPGTLGYFMDEMMYPLFSSDQVNFTRSFFTEYVSGRGSLPAFRIGNQPYGILPTSSFSSWKWSDNEVDKYSSYYTQLYDVLSKMENSWQALTAEVNYAGKSGEPFSLLLNIIGLQAGSVEFFQRIGTDEDFNWNLLSFQNRAIAGKWENSFSTKRDEILSALGIDTSNAPKIADISFYQNANQLMGNLIDEENPVSETETLTTYDGSNNYIGWLLSADSEAITSEVFTDVSGTIIDPPKALLYLALRNAYLQQIWGDTNTLYKQNNVISSSIKETSILNVTNTVSLTKMDYLLANVSTVLPETVTGGKSMRAIDFVLEPAYAAFLFDTYLADMKKALGVLKELPTARLERLFTEHLDTCSYRLDAWQTAIFTKRLEYLRTNATTIAGQTLAEKGLYIGAYGWVEDIRPESSRKEALASDIPDQLKESNKEKIWESDANGGYIHGLSLNHAITGAVLRNAYLAHATDEYAEQMSVNLSSQRVRKAMYYLDGIRNGQSMASLLGYAFERALHDNEDGLEMDVYIYNFREKFPLTNSQSTLSADATTSIAINQTTNGDKLLEAYRSTIYPYGVNELPASTSAEAKLIMTAIDGLADAMDAVGDLALGESVYQLVQGNYERGGSIMKAFSEGKNPPEPQIVNTPRKGEMITNRIALHLEIDPADNAWGTTMSAAANFEKGLNKWLASVLPNPTKIRCLVSATYIDGETGLSVTIPGEINLFQLDIQPIDFVLLMDKSFGKGASGIEKRIACLFKETNAELNDNIAVEILLRERDSAWTEEVVSFFSIIPLVKNLRDIITQCRPLHAVDLNLPSEAQVTRSSNLKGYDTSDICNEMLTGRLDLLYTELKSLYDTSPNFSTLSNSIERPADGISTDLSIWRNALKKLANYGFAEAYPASVVGGTTLEFDTLQTQIESVSLILKERLAQAATLINTVPASGNLSANASDADIFLNESRKKDELISNYTAAAKLLLGSSFTLIPRFVLNNVTEVQEAIDNSNNLVRYSVNDLSIPFITEEWLQGIGKVRSQSSRLDEISMYVQNLSLASISLTPFQLPVDPDDHWVSVEFPEEMKIDRDFLSVAAILPTGYTADAIQSGLLIDDWTELVPGNKETTGIAFHYNQPNAKAPQTVLLAITPEIKGNWTWNELMDILNDTLDRAKRRAVEPDQIDTSINAQFLPAMMTAFSNAPVTISTYWARNMTGLIKT